MSIVQECQAEAALTKKEVARRLSLSEAMVHKHTYPRGELRSFNIGRRVLYSIAEVNRWINSQRREPTPAKK